MRRSAATSPGGDRLVRILRSDAVTATERRVEGALVLDRDLLGEHASRDPSEAPMLTWMGSEVRVQVRKMDRFVFVVPGRRFDDLPGHPGTLGRYWTWVAHPSVDESLALMSKRPPRRVSGLEGLLRLYRMQVRLLRADIDHTLRVAAPCVVVAGLGAVEISGGTGSTRLARPEPLAKFDLDELRRRLQALPVSTTNLSVPCALPNSSCWHTDQSEAALRLSNTLATAYKKDPPDWLSRGTEQI